MSELEPYRDPNMTLSEYAETFAVSKMFPDIHSAAQAYVKIAAGAELGIPPFQSMNGIDIIKSKLVLKPALLRGLLDRTPDYDYVITWETDACTVTIFKDGKKRGDSRFSMDDAKKAGLAGKENYQKFERNMLLERATSNAIRWYAPGLTMGPAYVTGELTHDVEVEIPEGVTAKPRTRVTAEVIPDPVEEVTGEVEEPPLALRFQLTHMSAQEKGDLWRFAGLERNTKMSDVKSRLIAYADELGLDYTEEPDARLILDRARVVAAEGGSAEAFDHFARTGQDLDAGDQAVIA